MNLLNILQAQAARRHSAAARKAARALRPAIDALEKREVFTAGIAAPFVGPLSMGASAPAAHVAMTTPAPSSAQTGTALGLAWRFAPDGSASGGGTLFIQDVAKGTDPADPKNIDIAVNQVDGHMILDTDWNSPSYAASIKPGANVKVVVAEHSGDLNVYNDRGFGGFTVEDRLQSGNITVPYGYLGWTMDENVVTQKATFTIASGKADHSTYNINLQHLDPESTGTDPSNPITGLTVTDSGSDQGGCNFINGVDPSVQGSVKIVTKGGATFKNNTPYAVSPG